MPRHPGPQEVEKEVILILFGVCVCVKLVRFPQQTISLTHFLDSWDHLTSLWFEYRLITRKIRFRWQFVSALLWNGIIEATEHSPFLF